MRPTPRVLVPLKSMCSKMWESPAPSHCPSWMLPERHHACAETTGALRSSRTIIVKPLGKEASQVPWRQSALTLFSPAVLFGFLEKSDIKLFSGGRLGMRRARTRERYLWARFLAGVRVSLRFLAQFSGRKKRLHKCFFKVKPAGKVFLNILIPF